MPWYVDGARVCGSGEVVVVGWVVVVGDVVWVVVVHAVVVGVAAETSPGSTLGVADRA